MIKRVTAALMAALVIMTTTYNAYTFDVYAAEVVVGGELIDYLVSFIISAGATYMGYEILEGWDRNTVVSELHGYCDTTEGSSALKGVYGSFKVIDGGGGSDPDPEPPEDPDEILDTKIAGLVASKQLFDFVSGFFSYESKLQDSVIGASINEAYNQEITVVSPLPDYMHIASLSNRLYDDSMDSLIRSKYPEYSMLSHYYVQFVNNKTFFSNIIIDQTHISADSMWLIENSDGVFSVNALDSDGNKLNILTRYYAFGDTVLYGNNNEFGASGRNADIYVFGNINISFNNGELYHLYPDGSLEQLFDDKPAQKLNISLSTAEGKLTSVKPIVNMDISALVDAIGKAIADAYPDEAPVLSQEAINQIYNNVSNVYDNAVTNYYNDTSYIDQSQYITNVTNVYEQAIADNPAVDTPSIPSIPSVGLGSLNDYKTVGLSSVFPFCIPFDMYHLISVLEAEPKAISFDYTFYFGEYFDEYTLTVDLSIFDPVAKVFRTTQLILYIFGLILVTRNMIRG